MFERTNKMQTGLSFTLLTNKEIIEILDGDKSLGCVKFNDTDLVDVKMPYLSGPDICTISMRFGLQQLYGQGGPSRWQYFQILINYCIKENKVSELLEHLFSKSQFHKTLKIYSTSEIELFHKNIVNKAIENINSLLFFSDNELVRFNKCFIIRKIGTEIKLNIPKIKSIDREFIKTTSNLAIDSIEDGDFDSAITKSRTLLEEVFIFVLESEEIKNSSKGNINKLWKQVRNILNMNTNKDIDERINSLLSGLSNILNSIAEMRNMNSDSHGVGSRRININDYHARLFVNSAMTMADFILSVYNNQKK